MAEEKQFENRVKRFLKDHGCWYVKYWGGGGYTRAGVPDLLVCCAGVFIAVELKSSRGRPSGLQIRELRRIQNTGGIAVLLYPKDFHTFEEMILGILRDNWKLVRSCIDIFIGRIEKYG